MWHAQWRTRCLAVGVVCILVMAGQVQAQIFKRLRAHAGSIVAISFTADGKGLVSTGSDGVVKVWADGGRRLSSARKLDRADLRSELTTPRLVEISNDGRILVTIIDSEFLVWNVNAGEPRMSWWTKGDPVTALALSPDTTQVVLGRKDGSIEIIKINRDWVVVASSDWLRRHQDASGRWSAITYSRLCNAKKGPCKHLPRNVSKVTKSSRETCHHVSALAMLALARGGSTHIYAKYKEYIAVMTKGLTPLKQGLLSTKKKAFPHRTLIDHATATLAAATILRLTGDTEALGECVEKAADVCVHGLKSLMQQSQVERPGEAEIILIAWTMLALKEVKTCRNMEYLSQPTEEDLTAVFSSVIRWLNVVTDPRTGRIAGTEKAGFVTDEPCLTAAGLISRLCAGQKTGNSPIAEGLDYLMAHLPKWQCGKEAGKNTVDFMYWYFGSEVICSAGGKRWSVWNEHLQMTLLRNQRQVGDALSTGGCEDGSWDPVGRLCGGVNRVWATALGSLALEVYNQWERTQPAVIP